MNLVKNVNFAQFYLESSKIALDVSACVCTYVLLPRNLRTYETASKDTERALRTHSTKSYAAHALTVPVRANTPEQL